MKMNMFYLFALNFLFAASSSGNDDFFPKLDSSETRRPDIPVEIWKQACISNGLPSSSMTVKISPCINCTCEKNGTIGCVEWYNISGNQRITHNSCSNCDPGQFFNNVTCKCYDDHARLFRQPLELWKPTDYLYCGCDSQGNKCNMSQTVAENFTKYFNSQRRVWRNPSKDQGKTFLPGISISKAVDASYKDCNLGGLTLRHGTVKNLLLGGYPRCLTCACYNGTPYCNGIWHMLLRRCSSKSRCKELVKDASVMCRNPFNIVCEKETYSWSLDGCEYKCSRHQLTFKVLQKPWCQKLTATQFCASCGNKTEFFEQYGSKLTLCTRMEEVIDKEKICDGFPDCEDGSDEENCTQIYCSAETTIVANQSITWPRITSNSSFPVNCNQINPLWKGIFMKTCKQKYRQRAFFRKGTYCSCTDSRVFHFNMSSVGYSSSMQLLNTAEHLLRNVTTAVRASQYFQSVKNLSVIAVNLNHINYDFWKVIDSVLHFDAPCKEPAIEKQKRYFSRYLQKYHHFSFTPDDDDTDNYIGAQVASYKDVLISEKRIMEMLVKPGSIVIKPEWQDTNAKILANKTLIERNYTATLKKQIQNRNISETDKKQDMAKAKRGLEKIKQTLKHIDIVTTIEAVIGSISVFSCIICLVFYRLLRIEDTTKFFIHKNLFIAWILSYGLQIIGNLLSDEFEKHKGFCTAYLIINQYTLFSYFSWMSLEGFNLFTVLVFVFEARQRRHFLYAIFGWGLPLCIVTVEVGAFFQTFKDNKSCVGLEKNNWLFKGPMGFLLSVNCIFFCAIVFVLLKSISRSARYATKASKSRATGKAFLVLLPLLGLTFLLGYAVNNTVVMYIYVIVNSLMGSLLAIFHFCLDKTVQTAFKDYKRKKASQRNIVGDVKATRLSKITGSSAGLSS